MSDLDAKRFPNARARLAAALPDMLAGMACSEVAAKHGVSLATVRRWYKAIEPETDDAIEKAREQIRGHASAAVEALQGALGSDDWKVRVMAANSILDRAGVVKTERREVAGDAKAPLEVRITLAQASVLAKGDEP